MSAETFTTSLFKLLTPLAVVCCLHKCVLGYDRVGSKSIVAPLGHRHGTCTLRIIPCLLNRSLQYLLLPNRSFFCLHKFAKITGFRARFFCVTKKLHVTALSQQKTVIQIVWQFFVAKWLIKMKRIIFIKIRFWCLSTLRQIRPMNLVKNFHRNVCDLCFRLLLLFFPKHNHIHVCCEYSNTHHSKRRCLNCILFCLFFPYKSSIFIFCLLVYFIQMD